MAPQEQYYYKADIFIENLKAIGSIEDAAQISDLSPQTIDKWQRRHPQFSKKIRDALDQFKETLPIVLKNEAKRQLANAVFGRNKEISKRIVTVYDEAGNPINRTETTEEKQLAAPRWAIERVLDADRVSEAEKALRTLVDLGYIPKTLLEQCLGVLESKDTQIKQIFTEFYPNSTTESQKGLSEESANMILHQILGTGEEELVENTIDITVNES